MSRLTLEQICQEKNTSDPAAISSLHLSHRALSDVSLLSSFTYLERLDLSYNTLSSLQGLGSCINLKWLSVVQNKLQSLKGIEGLSKLTVLNAGRNKIRTMDDVKSLTNLRALILNDNEIAAICKLDQLKCLNTLVLSRNPIHEIGDSLVKVKSITKLSLSNCQIQTVGCSLKDSVDLKEVRLAHNEIMMLPAELAQNVKIQNLDLGNNSIRKWSDLKVLSSLHNLKNLNLQGNPIAEMEKLPKKIKKILPNLQIFNTKPTERGTTKENIKKDVSNHSKVDRYFDGATDIENVEEVKGKKFNESLVSRKKNTSGSEEGNLTDGTAELEAGKKARKRKPKNIEEIKPETIDGGAMGEKTKKRKPKNSEESKSELIDGAMEKRARKIKPKNVERSKTEAIDDGETPFLEIVLSSNRGDPIDSGRIDRDAEAVQDVKSLSGVVSIHSKKKKKTKSSGMGRLALEFLPPTAEVGMGGPSTWDD